MELNSKQRRKEKWKKLKEWKNLINKQVMKYVNDGEINMWNWVN